MTDPDWEEMAVVGRVARTHGTRGAVIVNPETDFPDTRFGAGRVLFVRRAARLERLTIDAVRFHQGRPIVTLREIASMTDAEALAGAELRVPTSDLAALPPGAFYRHDLVGCRVVTIAGTTVGVVAAVEGERERSRLVVTTPAGDVLVPVAEDICVRIDPAAREITIDPPDGLLDLHR
jgi:16S rRNA processing protein RimM